MSLVRCIRVYSKHSIERIISRILFFPFRHMQASFIKLRSLWWHISFVCGHFLGAVGIASRCRTAFLRWNTYVHNVYIVVLLLHSFLNNSASQKLSRWKENKKNLFTTLKKRWTYSLLPHPIEGGQATLKKTQKNAGCKSLPRRYIFNWSPTSATTTLHQRHTCHRSDHFYLIRPWYLTYGKIISVNIIS